MGSLRLAWPTVQTIYRETLSQKTTKHKQKTHLKVFFLKTIYGATESDESSKLKW